MLLLFSCLTIRDDETKNAFIIIALKHLTMSFQKQKTLNPIAIVTIDLDKSVEPLININKCFI